MSTFLERAVKLDNLDNLDRGIGRLVLLGILLVLSVAGVVADLYSHAPVTP